MNNEKKDLFWKILLDQKIILDNPNHKTFKFTAAYVYYLDSCIEQAYPNALLGIIKSVMFFCPEVSDSQQNLIVNFVIDRIKRTCPTVSDDLQKQVDFFKSNYPGVKVNQWGNMMSTIIQENKDV